MLGEFGEGGRRRRSGLGYSASLDDELGSGGFEYEMFEPDSNRILYDAERKKQDH